MPEDSKVLPRKMRLVIEQYLVRIGPWFWVKTSQLHQCLVCAGEVVLEHLLADQVVHFRP